MSSSQSYASEQLAATIPSAPHAAAGAQTLGMTHSIRDVEPPIRDFTTYHMSYRNVPLRDWQRHTSHSRASDISPQNPLAKPPISHDCYETTTGAASTFWSQVHGKTFGAPQSSKSLGTTGKDSFIARAKERAQAARQKEREMESFFAQEARYMYGLTDEAPTNYPEGVHPAVRVGLCAAPPAWPSQGKTTSTSKSTTSTNLRPEHAWTSRETAQLQTTIGKKIAQLERIKNGTTANVALSEDEEKAQRTRVLMNSIYPPDSFSDRYTAIKYNIAFTQPYCPPQPTTAKAAVIESQVKIDESKYPVRPHFKFNHVSLQQ